MQVLLSGVRQTPQAEAILSRAAELFLACLPDCSAPKTEVMPLAWKGRIRFIEGAAWVPAAE
jgi:hypothetical protein